MRTRTRDGDGDGRERCVRGVRVASRRGVMARRVVARVWAWTVGASGVGGGKALADGDRSIDRSRAFGRGSWASCVEGA